MSITQASYWLESAGDWPDRSGKPLDSQADVVVVGGGITGLSTALHLARAGTSVTLIERDHVAAGASGRNGSMCNLGFTLGTGQAIRRLGLERAREFYDCYTKAVDLVEETVNREQIECNFRRAGRLGVAGKPAHFTAMISQQEALAKQFGHETRLIVKQDLRREIGSDYFYGGLLDPHSAGLHVGRYARGLAAAAERHGVRIHERTPALGVSTSGTRKIVATDRGKIRADHVMMATGAYTDSVFPYLQRRLIRIGSFIIVTEPLGDELAADIMPGRRLVVDSRKIGHYIQLTPDNRLMFGGRARFAASSPTSDHMSAQILQREMVEMWPQLAGVRVDYEWGGTVGFTPDRVPHAGVHRGVHFSTGYCGHGVQMASFMGARMAEVIRGDANANPTRGWPFLPLPIHAGKPWFLPFVGAYYRSKDKFF